MSTLTWALLLILAAVLLIVIEAMIPAGFIGFIAAGCLLVGIGMLFAVETSYGLVAVALLLVGSPVMMLMWLKYFPTSWIGRRLTLSTEQNPDSVIYDPNLAQASELVGATGTALTDLRPVGTCKINDRRIECLAEGGVIDSGARIKVVSVQGNDVKVRRATD